SLGYRYRPTDRAYGFAYNQEFQRYGEQNEPRAVFEAQLAHAQPPLIFFWYRQSPQYLQPINGDALVSTGDPPPIVSGMVSVSLDPQGRLMSFNAVPPQVPPADDGAAGGATPWKALFAAAGLDPAAFTPTEPQWL